jgi:hypothetical protein
MHAIMMIHDAGDYFSSSSCRSGGGFDVVDVVFNVVVVEIVPGDRSPISSSGIR